MDAVASGPGAPCARIAIPQLPAPLPTVKALASSLSALRPQFLTVLSDFGEAEKFVIEGDSLLLHALSDPALDWAHPQFLHLTYVVETFLHELVKRGAHFCVVFFESHKAIWQGHGAKGVARSLLIRHLQFCLPATHTEKKIARAQILRRA